MTAALWICFAPFAAFALLAGLADLCARIWPETDCHLDQWKEWYD